MRLKFYLLNNVPGLFNGRPVISYIIFATIAEVCALIYLLAIPADPRNQIFLGFSIARLTLASGFLFSLILTTFLLQKALKEKSWENKFAVILFSDIATIIALLGSIFSTIVLFLSLLTTARIIPIFPNRFLIERLLPLMVLALLLFIGLLPFQLLLYNRHYWINVLGWAQRPISYIYLAGNLIRDALNRLSPKRLAVLAALVLLPTIFYLPILYPYPTGSAGLYSFMAELIIQNNFALPNEVPFYGPGGIPFAYPPLGFYLMALVEKIFGITSFDYSRIAPPLFSVLAILPLSLISYELTNSRAGAFFSALVVGTSQLVFHLHVTSGGVIRGLALFFVLCSILSFIYSERKSNWKYAAAAGVFSGLTVLSHFSYALFAFLFYAAYLPVRFFSRRSWLHLFIVGTIGGMIVLPWLLTIYGRYGTIVFTGAFQSHENNYFLNLFRDTELIIPWFENTLRPITREPLLWGLIVLGLIDAFLQRKYLLIIWLGFVLFFASESSRYVVVVGALLAAMPIARIYRSFNDLKIDDRSSYYPFFQGNFFLLVICLIFYSNWWINVPEKFQQIPGQDMMELATFVRKNLPADAVYLAFTQDGDAEWFPYLLQRTPAIGTWGAEWLGTYSENLGLVFDMNDCINDESYECVDMQLHRLQNKPGYLITTTANDIINKGLQAELNWQTIFQNRVFILWKDASN